MTAWTETPEPYSLAWRSARTAGGWSPPVLCEVLRDHWCEYGHYTAQRLDAATTAVRWMPLPRPDPPEAGRLAMLPAGTRVAVRINGHRFTATVVAGSDTRVHAALDRDKQVFGLDEIEVLEPTQEPR